MHACPATLVGTVGLASLASLPPGAMSILGPLRRRAGGKQGQPPAQAGGPLPGVPPMVGTWPPPGPQDTGVLSLQSPLSLTPSPSLRLLAPPGNSLGVVLRLVERSGSEARPEPRRGACPAGRSGPPGSQPQGCSLPPPFFAYGQWVSLRAGQGAEGRLWARMKPTRWNSASHAPQGPPLGQRGGPGGDTGVAGLAAERPHNGAPQRRRHARPGLLWPLVRGTERSLGKGETPWGQIPPCYLEPPSPATGRSG